jgi:hypothetical protein
MNEIFAIDPTSPEDYKDFSAMLKSFGPSNGRFIAKYPNDWLPMLLAHSESLKGLDQTRFKRLLELHNDAILEIDADYRRTKPWITNALEVLTLKINKSLILAPSPPPNGIKSLQDFLWDNESKTTSSVGDHIPMTIESYCKAIKPLLKISTEVHMVDQFFNLRDGLNKNIEKFNLLSTILKEADQSKRCEYFKIHFLRKSGVSDTAQSAQIVRDLEEIIDTQKLVNVQPDFTLNDKNKMIHGRYVFSIKGGIQFDYGFDIFGPKKTNHVHWLSQPELLPLQKMYGL